MQLLYSVFQYQCRVLPLCICCFHCPVSMQESAWMFKPCIWGRAPPRGCVGSSPWPSPPSCPLANCLASCLGSSKFTYCTLGSFAMKTKRACICYSVTRVKELPNSVNIVCVSNVPSFKQCLGLQWFVFHCYISEILGSEDLWPVLLAFSVVPALIQLVSLPFFPETPRYLLIDKGDQVQCEKGR